VDKRDAPELAHAELVEGIIEAKRRLDNKFERFIKAHENVQPRARRFDLYRYGDKARTEFELAEHWLDKLMETLDRATQVAEPPRESDPNARDT
jgi:superfamily I DNA and/or RNA helicase